MNKMINMFYESVKERVSVIDDNISVMAFNADRGCFTFMKICSNNSTDYFLMPFTPGLPTQSMPEEYDSIPFIRAFDVYYEEKMNWKQRAFLRFCIEYSHSDTAKNFEEWLSCDGEDFLENSRAFLDWDTLVWLNTECVKDIDRDFFNGFVDGYKERFGVEEEA